MRARLLRALLPVAAALALVLVAWSGPTWRTTRPGLLAVALDGSPSVDSHARSRALERVAAELAGLPRGTEVAALNFGAEAELLGIGSPDQALEWLRAAVLAGDGGTGGAVRAVAQASALALAAGGGSILLATDDGAVAPATRAVGFRLLPIEPAAGPDLLVERLDVPRTVAPGTIFEAGVFVRSSVDQRVEIALERDGRLVASRSVLLSARAGHAVRFLVAAGAGSGYMTASVRGGLDSDPGNNLARAYVDVEGSSRWLSVGYPASRDSGWERRDSLPVLEGYDALHLHVGEKYVPDPADEQRLADWVRNGRRLIVSLDDPGRAHLLRGGALEQILPVELEPPRRSGDSASVVLLLDRSGSMESDLADQGSTSTASARALTRLLAPGDRFGVIAFDVEAHVIRPLGPWSGREGADEEIPVLPASGGTDWTAALDLAADWLADETAGRRHMILVTDGRLGREGAEGEPESGWPDGVTLSTVSIGEDADRVLLRRLAHSHGGRHDHVAGPADLPLALRREAARMTLPETRPGPTNVRAEPAFRDLLPEARVGGESRLLVVLPRSSSEVALRTEQGDALMTLGRAGWGSVVFLAVNPMELKGTDGRQTALAALRLAAVAGAESGADDGDSHLTVGRGSVRIEIGAVDRLPAVRVRRPGGAVESVEMSWNAPGRTTGEFRVAAAGEYLLDLDGERRRLWYGAHEGRSLAIRETRRAEEFETLAPAQLRKTLRQLAPFLAALAALIFFVDSVFRQLRARSSFMRPGRG